MKYNFITQEYYQNQAVNIIEDTNSIIAINQSRGGGVMVNGCYLNSSPLNINPGDRYAGETISIGGNQGEIVSGKLQIAFDPTTVDRRVIIIQKYFIK